MGKRKLTESANEGKRKNKKGKIATEKKAEIVEENLPPAVRSSDEVAAKKIKWTNKQRVLVFASRGITYRDRHLMEDIRGILPHSKAESKKERKDDIRIINEMCEMRNCNKCIYLENKKREDLYMWMANTPGGPSAKFLVHNVHTMKELKMSGNSLRGTRPLLSFDETFQSEPHWEVLKELLTQTFGTPNHHPRSQPFIDHVFCFSVLDGRIWFRNYQIIEEDGQLAEIGPRFVLNPIKIFDGGFGGATLWDNPGFVTPNAHRSEVRQAKAGNYIKNRQDKKAYEKRRKEMPDFKGDPTWDVFQTIPPEEAKGQMKNVFQRASTTNGVAKKKKNKTVKKRGKSVAVTA